MLNPLRMLILLEFGGWPGRHRYRVRALGRKEPGVPCRHMMRPSCQFFCSLDNVTYF